MKQEGDLNSDAGKTRPGGRRCRARVGWVRALGLSVLALMMLLVAADRVLELGLLPPPLIAHLETAAEAVVGDGAAPAEYTHVPVGGTAAPVPMRLHFERRKAVALLLALEAMRAKAEERIVRWAGPRRAGVRRPVPEEEAAKVTALAQEATERVSAFLAVDAETARGLLSALRWPWLGYDLRDVALDAILPGPDGRPAALAGLSADRFAGAVREARSRGHWIEIRSRLTAQHSLTENQVQALRGWLCREALDGAFVSSRRRRKAEEALARYLALAPAQGKTVVVMAGAQQLVRAGVQGFGVLIEMLEGHPDLALPLLVESVRRAGVAEQARLNASKLAGPEAESAAQTLVALGPFGAEALNAAMAAYPPQTLRRARELLGRIRREWPLESKAFENLGADVRRWRRWYAKARNVL